MGGPAGVADAQLAGGGEGLEKRREALVDFPLLLARLKLAGVEHTQTRAVVAAVLQPSQPFEENGRRLQFSYVACDAAHKSRRGAGMLEWWMWHWRCANPAFHCACLMPLVTCALSDRQGIKE